MDPSDWIGWPLRKSKKPTALAFAAWHCRCLKTGKGAGEMKRFVFTCAVLATASLTLHAQQGYIASGWGIGSWQAIGATGTPDETSVSRILMQDNGWAEIRPEIASTSVKLRYNIPPVDGLKGSPEDYLGYELRAHARDNGPAARVIITIKEMQWLTGTIRILAQIDSDLFEPRAETYWGGGYLRDAGGIMKHFRPYHYAYWAEVQLIKTAPEGRPGIQALAIYIDEP